MLNIDFTQLILHQIPLLETKNARISKGSGICKWLKSR